MWEIWPQSAPPSPAISTGPAPSRAVYSADQGTWGQGWGLGSGTLPGARSPEPSRGLLPPQGSPPGPVRGSAASCVSGLLRARPPTRGKRKLHSDSQEVRGA